MYQARMGWPLQRRVCHALDVPQNPKNPCRYSMLWASGVEWPFEVWLQCYVCSYVPLGYPENGWYDVLLLSERGSVKPFRSGRSSCSADARAYICMIAFCMSSDVCSGCALTSQAICMNMRHVMRQRLCLLGMVRGSLSLLHCS